MGPRTARTLTRRYHSTDCAAACVRAHTFTPPNLPQLPSRSTPVHTVSPRNGPDLTRPTKMERVFTDNVIGRTVQTLDLRNMRANKEESRHAVLLRKSIASPQRFSVGSPAPLSSPVARRLEPTYAPAHEVSTASAAAIPMSTGTPAEAAAALAFFQGLERERDALSVRAAALEASLAGLVHHFEDHIGAVEATIGPASQYYTATFGAGHIGMILTSDSEGVVEVSELRDDPDTGVPLLAKATGKIFVGDHILAVNGRLLARYGVPTPDAVATEFRSASRPMTVLFRRNPLHAAARLAASSCNASALVAPVVGGTLSAAPSGE